MQPTDPGCELRGAIASTNDLKVGPEIVELAVSRWSTTKREPKNERQQKGSFQHGSWIWEQVIHLIFDPQHDPESESVFFLFYICR